jgi:hypothetical protein
MIYQNLSYIIFVPGSVVFLSTGKVKKDIFKGCGAKLNLPFIHHHQEFP